MLGTVLLDGLARRLVIGCRVAERDDDAALMAVGDELALVVQLLRCDGDDLDDVLIWCNLLEVGLSDVLFGLGAFLGWADERSFHVATEHACAFFARHGLAYVAEGAFERREVVRHGRGQKGGHAGPGLEALHLSDGFRRVIHRIGADTAVDVDVEKARRDIGSARVDARLKCRPLLFRYRGGGTDFLDGLIEEEREPFFYGKVSRFVWYDEPAVDDCFHGCSLTILESLLLLYTIAHDGRTVRQELKSIGDSCYNEEEFCGVASAAAGGILRL